MKLLDNRDPKEIDLGRAIDVEVSGTTIVIATANGFTLYVEMEAIVNGAAEIDKLEPSECDCWVAQVDEWTRFGTRYGAHNPECPVFRPSLDPVDAINDAEQRYDAEVRATAEGEGS